MLKIKQSTEYIFTLMINSQQNFVHWCFYVISTTIDPNFNIFIFLLNKLFFALLNFGPLVQLNWTVKAGNTVV